jgi:hypothetical protein
MDPEKTAGSRDLLAKMKDIEARAIARSKQRREEGALASDASENPPPTNVFKLPLWPDAVRAVPNGFLRSALFGAIRRGARRYMERERIAALEGIEIFYTGQRLDQGDLDLWEMLLHIARLQGLGNECRVTAYQLLKALGKTDSGKNRDILDIRLSRMKATGVDVHIGRYGYEGSLIDEVYRDKTTKEYVFRANPKLRSLFEPDQFTHVDWAVRRELDGQPLAQWLHGFYASHAKPYPISVAKLRELCGSDYERLNNFRRDLRKSLDILIKASMKYQQPFSYVIRNDIIHADKEPSKSQRKHLGNKIKK